MTGANAAPVIEQTASGKLASPLLFVQHPLSPVPANALNSEVVSAIAVALAKVGQYDRALQLIQRFRSEPWSAKALSSIAPTLIETGKIDRALQAIEGLESQQQQALAFAESASDLAEIGQPEQAIMFIDRAITLAGLSGKF
ncbi:hypothetical protein [Oscillatoria sp. FACHB-1406]|uniref:hypothetical protein n=1 Tax=Oscillatoria sp. FACHB-1406 TaxID=2692846 RepID=UPI001683B045|nr:hypothetical protein [Oscillatoria sp. FACHB-1406]MBD2576081.1 hypothetical protein [Oscillatoria sp. FACHB-1406]